MAERLNAPCAFFDVDTRIADERGERLIIGPRAQTIEPQLARILHFAVERRIPVVATTCVQTAPIAPVLGQGATHVRLHGDPSAALAAVAAGATAVFLERCSYGDGDANVAACVFDVFHANPYAAECIRRLGIRRWAVFGVSLEYCVRGAVMGLCRLGMQVSVLTDAVVPSPRPFGRSSEEVLADFAAAGARLQTTQAFLDEIDHG